MSLVSREAMVKDAEWSIQWRQKEIIKAKIRYDFTKAEGDLKELNRHLRELVIEENHLKVVISAFDGVEKAEPPPIYTAVLGA